MKAMKTEVEKGLAVAVATYFALRQDRIATEYGTFEMSINTAHGVAICNAILTSKSGDVTVFIVEVIVTKK